MTNTPPRTFPCFDRVPDLKWLDRAGEVAWRVNPANGGGDGLEAAGLPKYFWKPGTVLRVHFLDGEAAWQEKVMEAAAAWTEHANLDYEVVDEPVAEIRISFFGCGNWSALGTTSLVTEIYPEQQPTMCLSEIPHASPIRIQRIARHEFGHAIGLVHEHSSPASGMQWNRDKVYASLAGPPNYWSKATVEQNVFLLYDKTITQYSAFDRLSVMLYGFPPSWTVDGVSYPENHDLSPTDIDFVRSVYPGR